MSARHSDESIQKGHWKNVCQMSVKNEGNCVSLSSSLRLSKQHKLKLRGLAQEEKISISELIRRILKTKIHIKS